MPTPANALRHGVTLTALLLAGDAFGVDYPTTVQNAPGLVGYWRFEGSLPAYNTVGASALKSGNYLFTHTAESAPIAASDSADRFPCCRHNTSPSPRADRSLR
jgi:hypothetical protein